MTMPYHSNGFPTVGVTRFPFTDDVDEEELEGDTDGDSVPVLVSEAVIVGLTDSVAVTDAS